MGAGGKESVCACSQPYIVLPAGFPLRDLDATDKTCVFALSVMDY